MLYVASLSRSRIRTSWEALAFFRERLAMSVRKRIWKGPGGEPREAWVVDYVDQHGDRHLKTFAKKRDAEAHHAIVGVAVRAGVHTADSKSVTVARAAELWLESCEAAGLERATIAAYRQHADLHITPILGTLRLSQLTVPLVRGFEDRLRRDGRSPAMVRNARRSLGGILADAQERGLVAQNVVYSLRKNRRSRRADGNGKLKAGIDIPAPSEMRAIVGKLNPTTGRYRVLLLTAIFTGLRASELRGLRWDDIDLKRGEVHVRQRADRYGQIGRPKSDAGERTIPLPPMVIAALREHRLASPRSALGLVFPNIRGGIDATRSLSAASIRRRLLPTSSISMAVPNIRACIACATSTPRGASTAASMAGSNCR
jgi:integrase